MVRWRSREYRTASAFMGVPSLNFTPERSLMVTVLPPSEKARKLGRELREDLQVLIDLVELLAHVLVDDAAHVGPRKGGIENVRVLVERHDERRLGALRVGNACEERQDGEQSHADPQTLHHLSLHGSASLPRTGRVSRLHLGAGPLRAATRGRPGERFAAGSGPTSVCTPRSITVLA